eukprot:CAMPEP_0172478822 /NCGR_PEP_ID=MMETSP1066-20121228/3029_1 /TAXON_ID=671091 /ORGANISM="Coscinodiscus wailesii, Strain CCMP2513" /LENGTH=252 /DNA_ID=CAMNT_0013238721 /DNA_START=79 /DNA_END=834 /DNA_ORIENTATION=+
MTPQLRTSSTSRKNKSNRSSRKQQQQQQQQQQHQTCTSQRNMAEENKKRDDNDEGSLSSNSVSEDDENESPASSFLPSYLSGMIQHSHSDFFVSLCFDPRLVAQLMCEGFLPIATERYLIPKLHKRRCVIHPLLSNTPSSPPKCHVHTSRSTKKKSKRFAVSINANFTEVVSGCHEQHGEGWLYPSIVQAFKALHDATRTGVGLQAALIDEQRPRRGGGGPPPVHVGTCAVRLYSVEVWNVATGALAAGELG